MSQRVLITAGAGGIGLAIVDAFLAQGAHVHIADIDAEAVRRAQASRMNLSASVTDIADPAAVSALVHDVQKELGGLDVLVNNAGISGPTAGIEELDAADFNSVIAVNLQGTFNVTQAFVGHLKASDAASIITMSSLAGRFGYPNRLAYSTTKWGLVGFAKTLAMELGEYGITSNTIHPGAVNGSRMEQVLEQRAKISGRSMEEETQQSLANQSIKEIVSPEDVAALIVFLAGPHARTISGQMFPIDGDSKAAL